MNYKFIIILKNKIFQILLIVLIGFTFMCIVGTQYFAFKTSYNPILKPMIGKIYFPYFVLIWLFKYQHTAPKLVNLIVSIMNLVAILYSFVLYLIIIKRSQKKNTHGSAKYSTDRELKKVDMLDSYFPKAGEKYRDGVILGRTSSSKTIIDSKPTHNLIIAPSRSGKGIGIILPTLVNWSQSIICFDIKGENFQHTSKYRQEKLNNKVLRLAPCDPLGGTRYNPLKEIRVRTGAEVKDTEVISNLLVSDGIGEKKDHFQIAATSVFTAIILHLLYSKENPTMADIYDFLTSPNGSMVDKFTRLLNGTYISDKNIIRSIYKDSPYKEGVHPIVVQGANEILSKSDRERASVISTAINRLLLFKDPIVRNNTRESEFKLADILDSETPVTLYFCAQIEDMDRLGIYVRVVLSQFFNITMRREKHKHKCLMLLDEFPLYGKLDSIQDALGVIASFGIKIMLIAQNKEQIEQKYGKVNTIKQGCASSVFYAPNGTDYDTQKLISDILGNKTITYKTSSGKKLGGIFDGNVSINTKSRKLLEPDEVRSVLGDDKNIILLHGCNPTMGIKIRYYEEEYFNNKIVPKDEKEDPKNWAKIDTIKKRRK